MKTRVNIVIYQALFFVLLTLCIYSQPISPNYESIKFEAEQTATVVGGDGLIMRTEDGGLTWNVQTTGVTNTIKSYDFIKLKSRTVQIAVGENGLLLKSANNGASWEIKKSETLANINFITIPFNNLIICACDNGVILISEDLGETWLIIQTDTKENLNSIICIPWLNGPISSSVKFVAAGNSGTILISTDFGFSWQSSNSSAKENLNSICAAGNDELFAAGNNGNIINSTDGGFSWSTINIKHTAHINDIKFIPGFDLNSKKTLIGIASCDNGIILRSEDTGSVWLEIQTSSHDDLYSVSFGNPGFGISVGGKGTPIYTLDGGLTWRTREANKNASATNKKELQNIKLSQNYPNPFNPSTMISYELPFNASVTVKVFDLIGREVRTLASGYQASGNYNVKFDAFDLSSGIYFYVLRANSGNMEVVKTMRMILTK